MDIEEIETVYKQVMERAEKTFLDGIAKKQNISQLEKDYSKDFHKAKNRYYQSMSKIISRQKKEAWAKPRKKKGVENNKVYKVVPITLKLNRYQRIKIAFIVKTFRAKIKIKNFLRAVTPSSISYSWIKVKLLTKRSYLKTKEGIKSAIVSTKERTIHTFNTLKDKTNKTTAFIKNNLKKLWERLKSKLKRKKKEKSEEKKIETKGDEETN